MALTLDQLNSTTTRYFNKKIRDSAYDKSAFWKTLKEDNNIKIKGGTQIQFPIWYQKLDQTTAVGFREQVEFTAKETVTGGVDEWRAYVTQVMIPWDDNMMNRSVHEIVDQTKAKSQEVQRDMIDKLSTDLFATTQGAKAITMLSTMVDSADDYAGIAVSDAANWAGKEDNAKTTLVMFGSGSLSYMVNQATRGTDGPTLHITTRDLWSKYESILESQQRYEDKKMANLGFTTLTLKSKPVVADPFCTAKYWYGLDMTAFEFAIQEGHNMNYGDWMDLAILGFPYAKAKIADCVGNVVCHCRNTSFKMTVLDYTL